MSAGVASLTSLIADTATEPVVVAPACPTVPEPEWLPYWSDNWYWCV